MSGIGGLGGTIFERLFVTGRPIFENIDDDDRDVVEPSVAESTAHELAGNLMWVLCGGEDAGYLVLRDFVGQTVTAEQQPRAR